MLGKQDTWVSLLPHSLIASTDSRDETTPTACQNVSHNRSIRLTVTGCIISGAYQPLYSLPVCNTVPGSLWSACSELMGRITSSSASTAEQASGRSDDNNDCLGQIHNLLLTASLSRPNDLYIQLLQLAFRSMAASHWNDDQSTNPAPSHTRSYPRTRPTCLF